MAVHCPPVHALATWGSCSGYRNEREAAAIRTFAARFEVVPINLAVAERAVELRRTWRLKLPDALIWASARELGALLVTRNTGDFPSSEPDIRVPYRR